jgi:hypothetical protein
MQTILLIVALTEFRSSLATNYNYVGNLVNTSRTPATRMLYDRFALLEPRQEECPDSGGSWFIEHFPILIQWRANSIMCWNGYMLRFRETLCKQVFVKFGDLYLEQISSVQIPTQITNAAQIQQLFVFFYPLQSSSLTTHGPQCYIPN